MAKYIGYGDGRNGSISSASGVVNSYASVTATAGTKTVNTSLSVAVGDLVWLHQSRNGGSGVGLHELVKVESVGSGQFTSDRTLTNSYGTTAQAIKVPQYTGGVLSGSITSQSWNGSTGGIIAIAHDGDLVITGSLTLNGAGYRGGTGGPSSSAINPFQGEGTSGGGIQHNLSNGNGGGGGGLYNSPTGWGGTGGGGGGNASTGSNASSGAGGIQGGSGGSSSGNSELTSITFGGGGGVGGGDSYADGGTSAGGNGGSGGGLGLIIARSITITTGTLNSNGVDGVQASVIGNGSNAHGGGGGGGAGGSFLLKGQIIDIGTNRINTTAGSGGGSRGAGTPGGTGSVGRIHADFGKSFSGTSNPVITTTQDKSLLDPSGGASFLMNFM